MTKTDETTEAVDPYAPYGSDRSRGRGGLLVIGILYFLWFAALFWMAALHVGR